MEKTVRKNDIWTIFVYLILYSIAGFMIETIFGVFTKGVIESRKSFLYGPFCAIYGIGAISMIVFLRNEKNTKKLFLKGAIIGGVVEYLMSLIFEVFFHVKWWDYSNYWLNVNGRTCLFFAISWGFLAILLIRYVNPYIDKLIILLKEKKYFFKIGTLLFITLFCADALLTGYVLKVFYYRVAIENNLNITDKLEAKEKYNKILSNNISNYANEYYNDEVMLKTFPNMMIAETNNESIGIANLIDGFESYYYRLGIRE